MQPLCRLVPCLAVALLLVAAPSVVHAEKPNLSPEKLAELSTHIITGNVANIFERVTRDGSWETHHMVAEVRIDKCEKGEGLNAGDLVYVRYWHRGWIGAGQIPPGTNGHRGMPESGQAMRIYLARNAYDGFSNANNDGGYNVIGANGFELLKQEDQ